jgi:hypothetical protein
MIKDSLHVPKASPHETKRNRYTMMMLTNAIPTMRNTCDLSRIGVTMLGKLWWHMNEYTTPPKRFGSANILKCGTCSSWRPLFATETNANMIIVYRHMFRTAIVVICSNFVFWKSKRQNGTLKTKKRTRYMSNAHGGGVGPEKKPTSERATTVL